MQRFVKSLARSSRSAGVPARVHPHLPDGDNCGPDPSGVLDVEVDGRYFRAPVTRMHPNVPHGESSGPDPAGVLAEAGQRLKLGSLLSFLASLLRGSETGAALHLLDRLVESSLASTELACSKSTFNSKLPGFLGQYHYVVDAFQPLDKPEQQSDSQCQSRNSGSGSMSAQAGSSSGEPGLGPGSPAASSVSTGVRHALQEAKILTGDARFSSLLPESVPDQETESTAPPNGNPKESQPRPQDARLPRDDVRGPTQASQSPDGREAMHPSQGGVLVNSPRAATPIGSTAKPPKLPDPSRTIPKPTWPGAVCDQGAGPASSRSVTSSIRPPATHLPELDAAHALEEGHETTRGASSSAARGGVSANLQSSSSSTGPNPAHAPEEAHVLVRGGFRWPPRGTFTSSGSSADRSFPSTGSPLTVVNGTPVLISQPPDAEEEEVVVTFPGATPEPGNISDRRFGPGAFGERWPSESSDD